MSNRLAKETSPYLLQHKDNPVEWYKLRKVRTSGKIKKTVFTVRSL